MNFKSGTIELSIIIVNWNGIKFLHKCLKSIVENPPTVPYEIVIIDNVSTDKSVEWLKSDECRKTLNGAKFRLVESAENLGFGRANNLAIEQSESPFVFLLNPDTLVTPKAIDRLLETLTSDAQIGAVAPKLISTDGTLQYSVWGFPATPLSLLTEGLQLYRLLPKKFIGSWLYRNFWSYDERKSVPIVSGAAIMAKRQMIDEIGAFDADFFMYGEDLEWCVRMNKNGWKTFFEPDAAIVHLGGQSSFQRWGSDINRVKEEEGFIRFQKKCLPKYHVLLNLTTRLFILSGYFLKNRITNKSTSAIKDIIKLQSNFIKSIMSDDNSARKNNVR